MYHNGLWVYSSDDTEFIRRYSCGGDYSRIFAEATYSVDADTNWGWKKSHRFHRYTQIFSWDVFLSRRFRRWRRFFFIHRMTRNLFGGFPDEAITHGFSRRRPVRSVQIPPEVGKSPTKKNLCISVKSVGRNNLHKEKSASSVKFVGRNNPHKEKSVYICEICGTK